MTPDLPKNLPTLEPGWVWLTGAGPGDPGLLTLHALNGLSQADVVVYDALVGAGVLDLARRGCRREYAGKRGGRPSPTQPDISHRLIQLAGEGLRVLRLKGGDPFVFGRGGEEALALVAARVPFRVIPGVTAGIGGLAYAGIPITHRETNSAVTILTGHGATGAVPADIDWRAIAAGAPVIVVYMALKHLDDIAARLIAAGRGAGEPVAIVSKASLADQKVVETTLGACAGDATAAAIEAPAIIAIGEVVRLRGGLDWLGAIAGRELVADPYATRARPASG
ncbi:MAG: uroporphyrinogen-III C-methyltransferase [Alphaproteobacteria bacterium]|jgi:uroporphyrin-III C-methyltransferase|nr:uroporphyrinogen-III C-methyltransferase [Alphaproteobacteria bacterium]MDP6516007.1 uroporphyrinogen-III C-methyltransferase [Alphaproteobacteria bacterium]